MIAQNSDLTFLIQGGPGLVRAPRSKCYDGYWCIQLAIGAPVHLQFGQQAHTHPAPVLWISHPGPEISHETAAEGQAWIHRFIAFTGPRAHDWAAMGLLPAITPLPSAFPWQQHLDGLLELPLIANDKWEHALKINRLEGFLLELQRLRLHIQPSEAWEKIAQQQLRNGTAVAAVADACHMALSSFRRKFQQKFGCSPQTWRLQQRLSQAQRYLAETDLAITVIAHRLGYPSVFQFSKQFKQHSGLAPMEWRQANLHGLQ